MIDYSKIIGFQWDEGNSEKNWEKHKVSRSETESIFFNKPLIISEDTKHSQEVSRFAALGKTDKERVLMVIFTIRINEIRVISARDMHKKERTLYEKK